MRQRLFLLSVLSIFACSAFGRGDFRCTVKESLRLGDSGTLVSGTEVAKKNLEKEFIVDRETGRMSGGGFTNHMSGENPTVYDYKPDENGYKAITIYEPNHTVDYLKIKEYVDGEEKPFIYLGAWGEIVSGTCRYD